MKYLKQERAQSWIWDVLRREESKAVRQVMKIMNVEGRRRSGKKRQLNVIKCDTKTAGVRENVVGDRVERKFRTRVADPK